METLIVIVAVIFSVILHEVVHGYVAYRLGDSTAKFAGRLTLNPLPHIDPIGTLLLPAIFILPALLSGAPIGAFFAWAKPVPLNPLNFKDFKKDTAIVALAGPLTNIAIAVILSIVFKTVLPNGILYSIIVSNLFLGVLNLIPIPPIDGSKVISVLLPDELALRFQSIGQYGLLIFILLLFFPIGGFNLSQILHVIVANLLSLLQMPVFI